MTNRNFDQNSFWLGCNAVLLFDNLADAVMKGGVWHWFLAALCVLAIVLGWSIAAEQKDA